MRPIIVRRTYPPPVGLHTLAGLPTCAVTRTGYVPMRRPRAPTVSVAAGEGNPTVHRPHRPARSPRAPGRARAQPALVVARRDPGPVRSLDPAAVGRGRTRDPVRLLGALGPERLAALAEDRDVVRRVQDGGGRPARLPDGRPLVPAPAARRGDRRARRRARSRSPTSRPSSASPRCCRSTPAASASWPATTSRRPPTSACRSSASGCSTARATSRSRCPARAGSRSATRCSTPTGCRSRCCARRDGEPLKVRVGLPGGRHLVAQVWKAQVGRVPLLLLDSDIEDNEPAERDVTDRLYGGGSEHRLLQEMLLGIGGVRALRAYCRAHRRARPRGVPHQRGPRRLPRRRADPRAHRGRRADLRRGARGGPRRHRVHHPHAGAGRHRPVRPRPGRAALRRRQRLPRRAGRAGPRARRRGLRGRRPSVFNMAVMGLRLAQRANGVSELHGAGQPRDVRRAVARLRRRRGPDRLVTNGVHAPTWVAPRGARARRARRSA